MYLRCFGQVYNPSCRCTCLGVIRQRQARPPCATWRITLPQPTDIIPQNTHARAGSRHARLFLESREGVKAVSDIDINSPQALCRRFCFDVASLQEKPGLSLGSRYEVPDKTSVAQMWLRLTVSGTHGQNTTPCGL